MSPTAQFMFVCIYICGFYCLVGGLPVWGEAPAFLISLMGGGRHTALPMFVFLQVSFDSFSSVNWVFCDTHDSF